MCIYRGYTAAQVNHSVFNISISYFSKYKMCPSLMHYPETPSHMAIDGQVCFYRRLFSTL